MCIDVDDGGDYADECADSFDDMVVVLMSVLICVDLLMTVWMSLLMTVLMC